MNFTQNSFSLPSTLQYSPQEGTDWIAEGTQLTPLFRRHLFPVLYGRVCWIKRDTRYKFVKFRPDIFVMDG